jgi:hypothetical protein
MQNIAAKRQAGQRVVVSDYLLIDRSQRPAFRSMPPEILRRSPSSCEIV